MKYELEMYEQCDGIKGDQLEWVCPKCYNRNKTTVEGEDYPDYGERVMTISVSCRECDAEFELSLHGEYDWNIDEVFAEEII